jgi:hypothetical protein
MDVLRKSDEIQIYVIFLVYTEGRTPVKEIAFRKEFPHGEKA